MDWAGRIVRMGGMGMGKQMICQAVSKRLDGFTLYPVSFELEPGYILGVIGSNGSGKTTLLRTMMGSYRLDQTEIEYGRGVSGKSGTSGKCSMGAGESHGTDRADILPDVLIDGISLRRDCRKYKERIAFVLNETPFYPAAGAVENGELYGRFYPSFDMEKYCRLLDEMEVPKKRAVVKLSKGQQIRQQMAFALSYDAAVYFFDEPTGNLDVEFRDQFYQYIRNIVADGTKTVIYASHLVEEMEEFADYILWLEKPREIRPESMRYFGTLDELKSNYRMLESSEDWTGQIPGEWIVGQRDRPNHKEMLVCLPQKTEADQLRGGSGGSREERKLAYRIMQEGRYADMKEIMYYVEKGGRV